MNRSQLSVAALMLGGLAFAGAYEALSPAPVRAYNFYMTKDGLQPLRWWQRPTLEYHLSTTAPEETDAAGLQGLVDGAFETWIGTSCAKVPEVLFVGTEEAMRATTPSSLRAKPDNLIVYVRSAVEWTRFGNSPTWIAITKIAHDPSTGEIVDADVEINDGGFVFSYDDSPASNQVDFLSMLTHELGHFYGLDHSADAHATMYATYATSPADAMEARTLSQDDIDGICTLYTDVPVHKAPSDDTGSCGAGGPAGLWGLGVCLWLARRRRAAVPRS